MATQAPQSQSVPSTIKVSIKLDAATNRIVVESSHPLPNLSTITAQFTPAKRSLVKKAGTYNSLDYVIGKTSSIISFQEWSDAIARVLELQQENKKGASTEINSSQSMLILVGDTLCKMSPIKVIPPSKMMVEARKVILDRAKELSEYTISAAKLTASGIIRDATRQREEVERSLAAARNEMASVPPRWAVDHNIPLKFSNSRWCVRFNFNLQLRAFDVKYAKPSGREATFSWPAHLIDVRNCAAWVPLDTNGSYNITSIYLDAGSKALPHMSVRGACMSPADSPERISTQAHLNQLASSVARCNSHVQLDSLYSGVSSWIDDFKAAFPVDLYEAIKANGNWTAATTLAEAHNPLPTNQREEDRHTWTA